MFLSRKSVGKRLSMSDKSCVLPPAHLTNGFAPLANVINTSCLGNAKLLTSLYKGGCCFAHTLLRVVFYFNPPYSCKSNK